MGWGGPGRGGGRKPLAEEEKTRALCKAAITGKYGSIEDGLIALLSSGEPALIKFVFEHAIGKPLDKVEQSGGLSITAFWDKTLLPSSNTPAPQQK